MGTQSDRVAPSSNRKKTLLFLHFNPIKILVNHWDIKTNLKIQSALIISFDSTLITNISHTSSNICLSVAFDNFTDFFFIPLSRRDRDQIDDKQFHTLNVYNGWWWQIYQNLLRRFSRFLSLPFFRNRVEKVALWRLSDVTIWWWFSHFDNCHYSFSVFFM